MAGFLAYYLRRAFRPLPGCRISPDCQTTCFHSRNKSISVRQTNAEWYDYRDEKRLSTVGSKESIKTASPVFSYWYLWQHGKTRPQRKKITCPFCLYCTHFRDVQRLKKRSFYFFFVIDILHFSSTEQALPPSEKKSWLKILFSLPTFDDFWTIVSQHEKKKEKKENPSCFFCPTETAAAAAAAAGDRSAGIEQSLSGLAGPFQIWASPWNWKTLWIRRGGAEDDMPEMSE